MTYQEMGVQDTLQNENQKASLCFKPPKCTQTYDTSPNVPIIC